MARLHLRVDTAEQAIGRQVARKHRPLRAEQIDDGAHRVAHERRIPVAPCKPEARQLHRHLRTGGQRSKTATPFTVTVGITQHRHAGMVDNHRHVRVERQAIPRQRRKTALPCVVLRHVTRGIAALRVGVPVDDMADAPHPRVACMRGKHGLHLGIVKCREGDDAGRQPIRLRQPLQPLGLGERVYGIGSGIDMHRADDVPPRHLSPVIRG
ncbi:hypothetical protein WR25_23080 [Diploscapter pachys]|uniref:Uncharacterized protein n=1 Tax=Diploscapter pachys TaxID=2018661 RepID=A0A2A2JY63_9BILA|nr:hypothetical protein WR25_23080 [Diploscapter pachys]